jgi:two-component system sensor histidine kinase RpfC
MGDLRRRLSERGDSEHEQVLVRALIAALALSYLAVASTVDGEGGELGEACLPLAVAYLLGALLLVAHLLWKPQPLPARRFAGMLLDITTLTIALIVGESTAAVFYPFYLWITLGMGFRYGRSYLYVSAVLSLLSFALVIAVTDFWRDQPALAGGLWAALLLLPAYTASLLRKLTEAVARAEAANQAKSRFLATMSHELRTPLNAIIGVTDLLQGQDFDAEQRDLVRTARLAGENLLDMINDVLDVAKIEAGKATIQSIDFDLHALLVRIRGMLQSRATSRGLYLHLMVDPLIPIRLKGGGQAIYQVLINLVANGIKFTETGGVTLGVRLIDQNDRDVTLRFTVEDTGIGIPAEARERIFEQFAQADESTTRRYGGTGLGLTIARQLVRQLEGELTLDENSGGGTRFGFSLRLPVAEGESPALEGRAVVIGPPRAAAAWCERVGALGVSALGVEDLARARRILAGEQRGRLTVLVVDGHGPTDRAGIAPALLRRLGGSALDVLLVSADPAREHEGYIACLPPDASDQLLFRALHAALLGGEEDERERLVPDGAEQRPRRILLAEDNRTNQMVITRILERAGHEVVLAADGHQALDALEQDSFDLVLMDLNMPELGGLETVTLYRFIEPQRDRPPIAALTADVTEETRAACRAVGIEEIIHKPVSAADLVAAVGRLTIDADAADAADADNVYPHPRRVSAVPAVDHAHLGRLRQLDQGDGFFADVVREFISDAEQLVAELHAAAELDDAATFRDRAHALRSSAAYVGAQAMFQLCLGWRGISPAELARKRRTLLARLTTEFERMRTELLDVLGEGDEGDASPVVDLPQVRQPRA